MQPTSARHRQTGYFSGGTKLFFFGCGIFLATAGYVAGRWSVHRPEAVTSTDPPAMTEPVSRDGSGDKSDRSLVAPTPVNSALSPVWDEKLWQQLHSTPATVARNAELAVALEKLAAVDPQKAMVLARAEGNLMLRETLIQSALHGWGRLAPLEAANFALALPNANDRDRAIKSVLAGAIVTNPDDAVRTANAIMQQNPGEATGYGNSLIDGLCEAGNFEMAAKLAGGGSEVQQSIWMSEAYSKWAALQPEAAAQAANDLADPAAKSEALHGVIGGWATADPAGLAGFLAQQPAGGERGQMLGQALESWVQLDPVATAQWINNNVNQLGPDLDAGMEAVAVVNGLTPDTAVAWAGTINDQALRSQALTDILRNWVQTDFPAARNYFETTPDLLPADRQQISTIIAGMAAQ